MKGRSALALAAANLVAGGLNYLFLVHAASVLDAAAFGDFSAWLADVVVASSVASVVQYVSLDHRWPDARFARACLLAAAIAVAALGVQAIQGLSMARWLLGAISVVAATLLYALIGQLHARLWLGVVATSIVAMAVVRFALPFAPIHADRTPLFYLAQSACAFVAILVVAAPALSRRSKHPATSAPARPTDAASARIRLGRPILLAAATVIFPQLDVLVLSLRETSATLGAFARIALAARIVFFGGLALVTALFPYQLHAAKAKAPAPAFVRSIERWIVPAAVGSALVLALAADVLIFKPAGEARIWLFASCVAAALLVALLERIQRRAAAGHLRIAGLAVAGVVAAGFAASSLGVTGYVVAVAVADAALLLFAAKAVR